MPNPFYREYNLCTISLVLENDATRKPAICFWWPLQSSLAGKTFPSPKLMPPDVGCQSVGCADPAQGAVRCGEAL